jgi:ketol-acid reductoisomerase
MQTGEPKLNELRVQAADERIEAVGRDLRSRMHKAPQPQAEPA